MNAFKKWLCGLFVLVLVSWVIWRWAQKETLAKDVKGTVTYWCEENGKCKRRGEP